MAAATPATPVTPVEDLEAPLSPQARTARQEAKLRKDRAAFEAERTAQAEELAAWGRVKAAKTAGKRLDALRELFTDDEIADLYQTDLTAHYTTHTPEETPESRLEKLLDSKLEARTKLDAEAAEKAMTELRQEKQGVYMEHARKLLDTDGDKYPSVIRAIATGKMSQDDIFTYVERFATEHRRGPYPHEVFAAFERHLSPGKTTQTAATQTPAARTITGDMRSNASTTDAPVKSLDDEFDAELRAAGVK